MGLHVPCLGLNLLFWEMGTTYTSEESMGRDTFDGLVLAYRPPFLNAGCGQVAALAPRHSL